MKHGRRTVIVLAAAACLLVGGAVGGGLINAGAATSGSSTTSTGPSRGSNEDPAHEQGESAAREAAEDNGTATDRRHDCHGHGGSQADGGPGHESQQSPGAAQPSAPDSGAATTSPST